MTIQNEACNTELLLADGSVTEWEFQFQIDTKESVTLYVVTLSVDAEDPNTYEVIEDLDAFDVDGLGDPGGGTVTYPLEGDPLPLGMAVIIARDRPYDQEQNFGGLQGGFNPQSLEDQLDFFAMQTQQNRRDVARALKQEFDAPDPGLVPPSTPARVIGWGPDGKLANLINSAAEAEVAADRAEAAQAAAEEAALEADASAELAQEWAANPEDVPVTGGGGLFSARHYAIKAAASENDAEVAAAQALGFRNEAEDFRDAAELAAQAALLNVGSIYPDVATGEAATTDGDYFWVQGPPDGDIVATLYLNDTGVGVDQGVAIPSYRMIYDRFRIVADDDYAFRFTDFMNFDYGGFTVSGAFEIGKTWLSPNQTLFDYLSGRDDKDFIWAMLGMEDGFNELVGLRWRFDPNIVGVEILGSDYHIVWSTELQTSSSGGGGSEDTTPESLVPYFGPDLFGWGGETTSIYVAQMLQFRAQDAHLVVASIVGETGEGDMSSTKLDFDTDLLGDEATIQVAPRNWDGLESAFLPVIVRSVRSVANGQSPMNFKFLGIGDSIQNGAMSALMKYEMGLRGHTMTGVGTILGDGIAGFFGVSEPPNPAVDDLPGQLDEGRGGWEIADITFAVNDPTKDNFVGTGLTYNTVADYFAASSAAQQNTNTLLRPSTGGDPSEDIRNGMIMDFSFYFSRFAEGATGVPVGRGVSLPDVWGCNFITNDARDRPAGLIQESHFENYSLLFRRIRLVSSAPIVCWPVGTPRDPSRDALWSSGYINGIKGILQAIAEFDDDEIYFCPAFCLNDQNGIGYILRAATPDPITNVSMTGFSINVHPFEGARRKMARAVAAAVAYAAS